MVIAFSALVNASFLNRNEKNNVTLSASV